MVIIRKLLKSHLGIVSMIGIMNNAEQLVRACHSNERTFLKFKFFSFAFLAIERFTLIAPVTSEGANLGLNKFGACYACHILTSRTSLSS